MTILDEIFAYKREELEETRRSIPFFRVRSAAENAAPVRGFVAGLLVTSRKPALIAEVKRASPSKGLLCKDFDPVRLAGQYQASGAAAISVLTEQHYFQGHLDYLTAIRTSLDEQGKSIPLLRKDFLFDPYQIYEARAAGADAVLLIAAYLDAVCLRDLFTLTCETGMTALIEVHNRAELDAVLPLQPTLIGINNRDLKDFSVHLETTLKLLPYLPAQGVCVVAESGIHTRKDVETLAEAGVDAILVGESLVTAPDVAARVGSLLGCR